MNKAKILKDKIDEYYRGSYINYVDLIEHLKNGKIDSYEKGIQHSGYTVSQQDKYPAIFNFDDESILIVTGYNLVSAKEVK